MGDWNESYAERAGRYRRAGLLFDATTYRTQPPFATILKSAAWLVPFELILLVAFFITAATDRSEAGYLAVASALLPLSWMMWAAWYRHRWDVGALEPFIAEASQPSMREWMDGVAPIGSGPRDGETFSEAMARYRNAGVYPSAGDRQAVDKIDDKIGRRDPFGIARDRHKNHTQIYGSISIAAVAGGIAGSKWGAGAALATMYLVFAALAFTVAIPAWRRLRLRVSTLQKLEREALAKR